MPPRPLVLGRIQIQLKGFRSVASRFWYGAVRSCLLEVFIHIPATLFLIHSLVESGEHFTHRLPFPSHGDGPFVLFSAAAAAADKGRPSLRPSVRAPWRWQSKSKLCVEEWPFPSSSSSPSSALVSRRPSAEITLHTTYLLPLRFALPPSHGSDAGGDGRVEESARCGSGHRKEGRTGLLPGHQRDSSLPLRSLFGSHCPKSTHTVAIGWNEVYMCHFAAADKFLLPKCPSHCTFITVFLLLGTSWFS